MSDKPDPIVAFKLPGAKRLLMRRYSFLKESCPYLDKETDECKKTKRPCTSQTGSYELTKDKNGEVAEGKLQYGCPLIKWVM